jgi:membrane protease YdiL (CAAX protease family)
MKIESRRITLFLMFAFGIAWIMDLVIYFLGGLSNLKPGTTIWFLSIFAMFAPALAAILTRLFTHEGWKDTHLKVNLKHNLRYWLIAWVGTPLLLLLGMAFYFALFPQYFDQSLTGISKVLAQAAQKTGKAIPLTPQLFLVVEIFQAILLAPVLNSIATFGEEFGWRAYLLDKLMPLGGRKAMLLMGVIWGIWHWPFIFMGYEYGFNYPDHPWLGPLVFLWFTFIVGTFLAWISLKSESVWPAVIAHAALNGMAPLALLLVKGQPDTLAGPDAVGVVASVTFAILALILLWRSSVFASFRSSLKQNEILSAHAEA